jgi:hypothetical protein
MRKKAMWIPALSAVCGITVLLSCQMANNAADNGVLYPLSSVDLSSRYEDYAASPALSVAAFCCWTEGSPDNALDGDEGNFWHNDWNKLSNGHIHDTGTNYYTAADGYPDQGNDTTHQVSLPTGKTVLDYVPAGGAHWFTVDLGTVVDKLGRLDYLPRNTSILCKYYEVYISETVPIGWDVSDSEHIKLIAKGQWSISEKEWTYAYFEPQPARYVQFRWLYAAGTEGGNATIGELKFGTADPFPIPPVDDSALVAAYTRGKVLLSTLDPLSIRYKSLKTTLSDTAAILTSPARETCQLSIQSTFVEVAATLNALLDSLDPPRKPPVEE